MKTFPIILTDKEHKEIKQEALNRDQSIKDFIFNAINNSLASKEMKEAKLKDK